MIMAKRAYQGGMPKPDRRGYYRPEVGGVRFIVGHKNEVSEGGEARRRLEAVRDLFNRQATCFIFVPWRLAGSVLKDA
jgi:hypothetical protein